VSATATSPLDLESREWVHDLQAGGAVADAAIARLHALLLRAARFEVGRRRAGMPQVEDEKVIALEAADDALMSILRRLDDFRGDSRFTTWAYKFAVLEAAVKVRKHAWRGRDLPTDSQGLELLSAMERQPDVALEQRELLRALEVAIASLTPHQRLVLVALAIDGVPIDVLAERLNTSRGALYKALHDARRKLRRHPAVLHLVVE
jgi:RNA polymerase sigma-70 factor (ECF subfamily)